MDDLEEALVAGAQRRMGNRAGGPTRFPTDEQVATFRYQVVAMLSELDDSTSVRELVEALQELE